MNDPLVQNQGAVEKQANVGTNNGTIIVGSDNSQNSQAGQIHIHQGMNYDEVRTLCLDLVQKELTLYKQQAIDESMRRFNRLMDKFLDQFSRIEENKRQRLQEPAIQNALNETFKEYVKSGKEDLGDDLIDLMIERVEVKEYTTRQSIIDEVRQILPKLSSSTVSLISLLTFSQLIIPRARDIFIEMLHKLSPLVENLQDIHNIDVAYLEQIGCGQSFSFLGFGKNFEQRMLSNYNLLFYNPITIDQFNAIMAKYGYNQNDKLYISLALINLMDTIGKQMQFKFNSYREDFIIGEKKYEIAKPLSNLLGEMRVYDEKEVRKFFLNINPNWTVVFDKFNKEDIKNFTLSPVGSYIGTRKLSKIFGQHIPLSVFYKE